MPKKGNPGWRCVNIFTTEAFSWRYITERLMGCVYIDHDQMGTDYSGRTDRGGAINTITARLSKNATDGLGRFPWQTSNGSTWMS
jgi:hypothetical protein